VEVEVLAGVKVVERSLVQVQGRLNAAKRRLLIFFPCLFMDACDFAKIP